MVCYVSDDVYVEAFIDDGTKPYPELNEEKITGIEVMQEEKKSILQLDGLFVYIGSIPNTSFLKNIDIHFLF